VFDNLSTPLSDAARIGQLLESRYGFQVVTLEDPSQLLIKQSINNLFDRVKGNDNLLVYFAGRGNIVPSRDRKTGYWLPTNADRPPDDTFWLPNEFVTNHLARIEARRVLVVSDSAYAGLISDDPNLLIGEGYEKAIYINRFLPKRSRLLLASGVDFPVADSNNDKHSVFAQALISTLENNNQILAAPALYRRIKDSLKRAGEGTVVPSLKAIKAAGHEHGDFFFVPVSGSMADAVASAFTDSEKREN
jgi:hypothetical protein